MTIQEAVDKRIERFNRLYLTATGHTFEEDEQWCKDQNEAEFPAWEAKVKEKLTSLGYESTDAYFEAYSNNPEEIYDEEFFDIWKRRPYHTSNYSYEKFCIDQAVNVVEFIRNQEGTPEEIWDKYVKQNGVYVGTFDFVKGLQADGFKGWSEEHSGNTGEQSILFAQCILFHPIVFQYMHGALAPLCGDEGYYDDRSDIPSVEEIDVLDKENPLT